MFYDEYLGTWQHHARNKRKTKKEFNEFKQLYSDKV